MSANYAKLTLNGLFSISIFSSPWNRLALFTIQLLKFTRSSKNELYETEHADK